MAVVRRPPDSLVERYFDAFGGWSNQTHFNTCMTRIIRDQLRYSFDTDDARSMDAHATTVMSLWYDFVDRFINENQGRFPYSWIVSDKVFVLPDKQDNEDFWESFIDALVFSAKTMKRSYMV